MDTLVLYGLVAVAAIILSVGLRFVVYTVLVKSSGWLPEKASKIANLSSVVTLVAAVVAMIGNAVASNMAVH